MKKLLLLISIAIISCNQVSKESGNNDDIIVEVPVVVEDTPVVPIEASDSLKEARIKAKDSIKNTLGK